MKVEAQAATLECQQAEAKAPRSKQQQRLDALDATVKERDAAVEAEVALRRELEAAKADAVEKRRRYQQFVADKERSIAELSARNAALEADIESGGHTDRKIMQLAQAQAKRDALQAGAEKRVAELEALVAKRGGAEEAR